MVATAKTEVRANANTGKMKLGLADPQFCFKYSQYTL